MIDSFLNWMNGLPSPWDGIVAALTPTFLMFVFVALPIIYFGDRWLKPSYPPEKPRERTPLRVIEMTDDQKIEFNEKLAREHGNWRKAAWTGKLIAHPTIGCIWNIEPGETGINMCHERHGKRMAVWRRDMAYPCCASCMIEDPYE